ncbi:MAG: efflux RND transporter permease subunit, partial [Candidatus Zophobacter franzmannii]|nr:efflux RND transporter permease subunit [Candidatus Zophobacter franzmannii]
QSPQDIDDQVTYPLTTSLLGIPGVQTIRSNSMFGFSSIYIIFNDKIDFYDSRTRILEKLNSLPPGLLPNEVQPSLGPDATALGQIFWYTLEGRDKKGKPTGGWDPAELRTIQDYQVKLALSGVSGVSEVASIGGHVKEYQVDVNPRALERYGISLQQVVKAVRNTNKSIGARTLELNRVEYFIRGIGYVESISDIEEAFVKSMDGSPLRIKDLAHVSLGPANRRGILDKDGAEVTGGVVVARYGTNPMEVIESVKEKIAEISPGLPSKTLSDGRESQLKVIPFYDRTGLIKETLGTLEDALILEIIVTILVIILMVMNISASALISLIIPIAVLFSFILMRYTGVEANIVALSGIAIAIGTLVDVGIVMIENILRTLKKGVHSTKLVLDAVMEVTPAIITAILTTIISFIPVFTLQHAEGKLFRPLAFTKTYVLTGSLFVALLILPTLADLIFRTRKMQKINLRVLQQMLLIGIGTFVLLRIDTLAGVIILLIGFIHLLVILKKLSVPRLKHIDLITITFLVLWFLAKRWLPLGPNRSLFVNFLFVAFVQLSLLGGFWLFRKNYERVLTWALDHKKAFLAIPSTLVLWGLLIWLGWSGLFGWVAVGFDILKIDIRPTKLWSSLHHTLPGIGSEFMPALDEGTFLLMPTSMPHSGVEENKEVLSRLDMAVSAIPEVEMVVGKAGRVNSALDPAPLSMYENVIQYKSEYRLDENGRKVRFAVDKKKQFIYDEDGKLIPNKHGRYFRQWRDEVKTPDDIWQEIVKATSLPGVTSAPKLQPIETRLVMLQTGMRAPMGIKILANDQSDIEKFALQVEKTLQQVPSINKASVFADRLIGKPYIEVIWDREALSQYGLQIEDVQTVLMTAVSGIRTGMTVEGRERYSIRVRYPRDYRDSPESLMNLKISTPKGIFIPLSELAEVKYTRGPQVIKSEDTFLVGYVIFDKLPNYSDADVIEQARDFITSKLEDGELKLPSGVTYSFTGNYENQLRANKRLSIVIPIVLALIVLILYMQFRSFSTSMMVFTGIGVAFAGGFIMLHLYSTNWFLNFSVLGTDMRTLFQIHPVYLSVAVWVGFIALFGIATDDGVLIATYLNQVFKKEHPETKKAIRTAVIEAGLRRVRPCLMTTATTLLALTPVLTGSGRGSDIMIPMAIPIFGGMAIELITLFVIPVLYSMREERKLI